MTMIMIVVRRREFDVVQIPLFIAGPAEHGAIAAKIVEGKRRAIRMKQRLKTKWVEVPIIVMENERMEWKDLAY